jgi:hypothetical protein
MMVSNRPSQRKRACLLIPLGLLLFIIILISASALSNLGLPQPSTTVDQLSVIEKARLSEVLHLRKSLGDATWPGWSQADIPLIVYNEKYAFLLGYPDPPAGWKKVPTLEQRGGAWEEVPGDQFEDQQYYRTQITDPNKTPQAFTVLVGERWVASFMTREYSQVTFYKSFRQGLPPFVATLVPARLAWSLLLGKTETHIAAFEHESFHAFEGMLAPSLLDESESMYDIEATYPYDKIENAWYQEMDALLKAAQAKTDAEATDFARQFLQLRSTRRARLSAAQVEWERLREWEEGLAKYAELEITRQAALSTTYMPLESLSQDKDFHNYRGQRSYWAEQLKEAANSNISGDTRFYYSGNAIAVVLDRLMPGWKPRALPSGEYLDVLLQDALQ